jgi:hypothetical protein
MPPDAQFPDKIQIVPGLPPSEEKLEELPPAKVEESTAEISEETVEDPTEAASEVTPEEAPESAPEEPPKKTGKTREAPK